MNIGAPFHPYASLYVGDLDSETTEAQLFEKFSVYGNISAIRLCRDAITRRSLGYAYVNFYQQEEAEEAMNQLNSTLIRNKPCRIMWSQRDPSIRKTAVGNIFIKNLHKSIDHKSLHDTFVAFGKILSCKVAMDENEVSRGYGFVHFEKEEDAKNAIEQVNGMSMMGHEVYVGPFIPNKERMKTKEKLGFNNLFVKNFDETIDQQKFKELFAPFGNILSSMLVTDSAGKSKGFGFIAFENPDDAKKACDEMNGKTINGKQIYVGRAQKKAERQQELKNKFKSEMVSKYTGVNLYVKNLSEEIDDKKLREEFAPYGNITSAEVMKDDKGNSKGFGFVCFSTPEEANKASVEMNFKIIGTKPIYVALAQRKEQRRAQLAAQYSQMLKLGGTMGQAPGAPHSLFPGGGPVVGAPPNIFPAPSHPMYFSQSAAAPPMLYHPLIPPPQQQQQQPPSRQQQQQQPSQNVVNSGNLPNQAVNIPGGRGQWNPQQQQQQQNPNQAGAPYQGGSQRGGPRHPSSFNRQGGQNQPNQGGRGQSRQQQGNSGQQQGQQNRQKATHNPRNQQQQQQQQQSASVPAQQPTQTPSTPTQQPTQTPSTVVDSEPALTMEQLAHLTPEQKKEMIGERLFPLIHNIASGLAGKITGMFLESSTIENLLVLLHERELLNEQVEAARQILQLHGTAQ